MRDLFKRSKNTNHQDDQNNKYTDAFIERKAKLLGSLLLFTQVFFELRTGKEFNIVRPISRLPRQHTICEELTRVLHGETTNLLINIQPGAGKSELLIHFIAWCLARYPDSNFLYVSYSKTLAEKHTHTLKQIIEMPEYRRMFDVELRTDSSAKGAFTTTAGGAVYAVGSSGTVTGLNAGLPGLDRFSGGIILDDVHKADEVHSDTLREAVIRNYRETILSRKRSPTTPLIAIGQRLHEADLFGMMVDGNEGHKWRTVILKTLDDHNNNLCPDVISTDELLLKKNIDPYVYASQYQQNPQPSGGGIFKTEWWPLLQVEPKILGTIIVCDSAETSHTYNDATAFLFAGIYFIEQDGVQTGILGAHIIHCVESWIEPRHLEGEFMQFYAQCMRHPVKPMMAAIEKKSTGTTLISLMKQKQGLQVHEIERTRASGSKTARFLETQPFIASKRVSLMAHAPHTELFLNHMSKITANDTHARDDICDTVADLVRLALIDRIVPLKDNTNQQSAVLDRYEQLTRQQLNTRIGSWQ